MDKCSLGGRVGTICSGSVIFLWFLTTSPTLVQSATNNHTNTSNNDTATTTTKTSTEICSQFNYNCPTCADFGCYYCPLTGVCHATTTTTTESSFQIKDYSCTDADDFVALSFLSRSASSACEGIATTKDYYFSDPLVSVNRWALDMIDVESVWREKGYFGLGVHVRVNDNTLYHPNHDEFGENGSRIDWENSCAGISNDLPDGDEDDDSEPTSADDQDDDADSSNSTSPSASDTIPDNYSHGMMVASLIGAEGDNGICSVGVAPQVTLSFCTAEGGVHDFLSQRIEKVDISHNSWAQPACQNSPHSRGRGRRMTATTPTTAADQRRMKYYRRKLNEDQARKVIGRDSIGGKDGDDPTSKDVDLFTCPFSYRPQQIDNNRYNITFPCDSCPEFILGLDWRDVQPGRTGRNGGEKGGRGEDGKGDGPSLPVRETSLILNEDCSKAIKDHCYVYFDQDNDACIEYMDVLLEDGSCEFGSTLTDEVKDVLTDGITKGRDGKGIIYIFSSGNAFMSGDDAGLQPYAQNTRFTITVGAVAYDGQRAWYSTPSAKVFISAPGGDYRLRETQMIGAGMHGSCEDSGSGTSFSAPLVSGVVALMLEANPDLTWRDVQAILASTSKRPSISATTAPSSSSSSGATITTTAPVFVDETEAINGGGYWHSHYYGFGIVNAAQAVEMAETWDNLAPETTIVANTGILNYTIFDDPTVPLISNLTIPSMDDESETDYSTFVIETVYLYLALNHSSRGHLTVNLTSPQGMVSVVSPGNRPESGQAVIWQFTTVRSWGESPVGDWTLSITDTRMGDVKECFDDGVNCNALEAMQYCKDGLFDPYGYASEDSEFDVDKERLAMKACCVCGGGIDSELWPETLLSWQIIVHGHIPKSSSSSNGSDDEVGTISPSSGGTEEEITTSPPRDGNTSPPNTTETDTEEEEECQSIGKEFNLESLCRVGTTTK
jgi:hypothetical protein